MNTLLIFTDWYVPGYKAGGPIQSVFNLADLMSKHYKVKIVTRNVDYQSVDAYLDIIPNVWTQLSENHEVMYCSSDKINSKLIKQLVKQNTGNRILINGLFSFYFSFLPLLFAVVYGAKQLFVSVRGMLHQSALSVKPFKKQIFLAFARGFGLYKSCILLASNQEESEEIKKVLGNQVKIKIINNIPLIVKELSIENKRFKSHNNQLRILFLGRISEEKNPNLLLDALKDEILPIKLTFCGAYVNQSYFELFHNKLKNLPINLESHYINELPHHQIQDLFSETDVMVLPSLGENFGHAIFESFAFATPVIIGNNTPWKNIKEQEIGIEINPNSVDELKEAIHFFNDMQIEIYKKWQLSSYNFAKTYIQSNNFEEMYLKLFS
jgi:glycosyltransferase involved in cell wall biosynthesis